MAEFIAGKGNQFESPCTETEYVREVMHLPSGWRISSWRAVSGGVDVEGACYPKVKTRGKYKGETDWRVTTPGTSIKMTVLAARFAEWSAAWENRTGLCSKCSGSGEVFASWHHEHGTKMKTCFRCGGSGIRPTAAAEAA